MADAPEILKSEKLRDSYPKLNAAIRNSNEALSTANTAKSTADTAKSTADTALANSENTQTQLDTIVINGDSSVEAAQARVASDGTTYTTLQERLNSSDAQLADVTNKTKGIYSVFDYGAKGDGTTDDTAAFQSALDAVPDGAVVMVGRHRLHGTLNVSKHVTFRGISYKNGNDPGSDNISRLYFDMGQVAIQATEAVSFEYLTVTGNSTGTGIVTNKPVIMDHASFQSFTLGMQITTAYYSKFSNSYIGFCTKDIVFDNCYNINMSGMTFQASDTSIELKNGSFLRMHGGSIERFTNYGILLSGGSSVDLFGTYFEGVQPSDNGISACIKAEDGSAIIAVGCQVYLTATSKFIDGIAATTTLRLFSRGNRFNYPTGTNTYTVKVYNLNFGKTGHDIDISGDNWDTTAGPNVTYSVVTIANVNATGRYRIIFPANHPSANQNVDNIKSVHVPDNGFTNTPAKGTMLFARNNGGGTNPDPLNIHTPYGYNPYMAIYQGTGQWEKVGIRLPNQADSTATDIATLKSDFNSLLAKLRANGVMI